MRSLEKTRADINAELNSVIEHVQEVTDQDAAERNQPRIYPPENQLPDHAHGQESKPATLDQTAKPAITASSAALQPVAPTATLPPADSKAPL